MEEVCIKIDIFDGSITAQWAKIGEVIQRYFFIVFESFYGIRVTPGYFTRFQIIVGDDWVSLKEYTGVIENLSNWCGKYTCLSVKISSPLQLDHRFER